MKKEQSIAEKLVELTSNQMVDTLVQPVFKPVFEKLINDIIIIEPRFNKSTITESIIRFLKDDNYSQKQRDIFFKFKEELLNKKMTVENIVTKSKLITPIEQPIEFGTENYKKRNNPVIIRNKPLYKTQGLWKIWLEDKTPIEIIATKKGEVRRKIESILTENKCMPFILDHYSEFNGERFLKESETIHYKPVRFDLMCKYIRIKTGVQIYALRLNENKTAKVKAFRERKLRKKR